MKKAIRYLLLTLTISWIIAGVAIALGIHPSKPFSYTIFGAAYMALPAIIALTLQTLDGEKPFKNFNFAPKINAWFIIAGVVPILFSFAALGINLLLPGISFSASYEGLLSSIPEEHLALATQQLSQFTPLTFLIVQVTSAIVAGYTINALFALGEEYGWRSYLLKALKEKKFIQLSLITGVVWGVWHFPLILVGHNYPQHPLIGVPMMILFCTLVTPLITYIVIKSKSVITAAIFHGVMNAIGAISIIYVIGGNDLTNGVTGVAGFITLLLFNIVLYLYDRFITKEQILSSTIADWL